MKTSDQLPHSDRRTPPWRRGYVLALLTAVYTLAIVDRQVINILAEPIKRELHVADWQMGALAGFAFAILYTALGLPLARYSERGNRPVIIAVSLLIWSGFTALSGLASNFSHLLLARIGVGVGEAGCLPPAHSLITDSTPREKRASALAIFSAGLPLGALVGLAIGGFAVQSYGWRGAFLLVGAPGALFALLVLMTVGEPRATKTGTSARVPGEAWSLPQVFGFLLRKRSFVWMTAGASLLTFVAYAHQSFYASFFLRNHGAEIDDLAARSGLHGALALLGICLGLILGIAGTLGTMMGGRLGDRLARRDASGYMIIPVWASFASVPLLALTFLLPRGGMALAFLAVPSFVRSMWYGSVFAAIQSLATPATRATAVALFLLFVNVIGVGFGPMCTGALSDLLSRQMSSAAGLRWAMVAVTLLMLAGAFCFRRAGRTLREDLAEPSTW